MPPLLLLILALLLLLTPRAARKLLQQSVAPPRQPIPNAPTLSRQQLVSVFVTARTQVE